MGIMDFFNGSAKPNPMEPVQQPTAGNIPANAGTALASTTTQGTAPNGAVPATTDITSTTQSPLDAFTDLWKNDPNVQPVAGQPLFNVDPNKLLQAAQTQSFIKHITPETMTAIQKGGPEAMSAMVELMNTVAQHTYAQSALATTKIVEGAMGRTQDSIKGMLPGMIRSHNVTDTLRTENPAFAHPAAQPLISAMENQMAVKYPNATAKELRDMATQYLTAFNTSMSPQQSPQQQGRGSNGSNNGQDIDWTSFL